MIPVPRVWVPPEWWQVLELAFRPDLDREVLRAWRGNGRSASSQIGRGKPLKAKDFDNAVRAADRELKNGPDRPLSRATWYVTQGIAPTFARPPGWEWTEPERLIMAQARRRDLEPVFFEYDKYGIFRTEGPKPEETDDPWAIIDQRKGT